MLNPKSFVAVGACAETTARKTPEWSLHLPTVHRVWKGFPMRSGPRTVRGVRQGGSSGEETEPEECRGLSLGARREEVDGACVRSAEDDLLREEGA